MGTSKGTGPQGRGARGDPLSWEGGRKIKGRREGYSNTSVGGTTSVGGRTLDPKLNFSH